MRRLKRRHLVIIALAIVLALPHYIPLRSRTGLIDRGLSNLCVGYGAPVDHDHRLIPHGMGGYERDDAQFDEAELIFRNGMMLGSDSCAEPATLRLYLY